MKLTVSPYHFSELLLKGYSLDQIYLLKLIEDGIDISVLSEGSDKIAALIQSLVRKGLMSKEHKITTVGKEILIFAQSTETTKIVRKKPATTEFEEWWKAYPGTDTFEHKGRKFSGSRSLRVSKDNCRLKYDKILLEGEYDAATLLDALKYDVTQKKEVSVKTGTNKLAYMQNSLTYLNQRSYEPFIELIQSGDKLEESPQTFGGTDI